MVDIWNCYSQDIYVFKKWGNLKLQKTVEINIGY